MLWSKGIIFVPRQDWEPGWQVPYLVFPLAWMRCPAYVTTREAVHRGLGPHRAERIWLPKQPHLGKMRPWRRGDTWRPVPKPGAAPSGCSGRGGLGPAALSLSAASPARPSASATVWTPPQSRSPGLVSASPNTLLSVGQSVPKTSKPCAPVPCTTLCSH